MTTDYEMLKRLTEVDAVPGNEREARKLVAEYIKDTTDEIQYDGLGSIIGIRKGKGPKIALAGHLDEVGFMVTAIDDEGFIKFQPLGGWWTQVMLAQLVTITTGQGKKIKGVIGSKPPHILKTEERKKVTEMDDIFIDLGVANRQEVEDLGVKPGDMVTPYLPFQKMANEKYLLAKAWDNRIGCAVVIEVLKKLKNKNLPNQFFGINTVQEEVGLRGATTVANKINPDISFAIDVSIAGDVPGVDKKKYQEKMGSGPSIGLYDASMIGHHTLREFAIKTAKDNNIAFQYAYMPGGGQDAGAMSKAHNGAPSLYIGVPSRYIHSHTSIIHEDDFNGAVDLITAMVEKLDQSKVKQIILD